MAYYADLTSGLQRQRLGGKYSDVTIKCGGKSFPCHRIVLAATSEYFEVMFEANMQESLTSIVDLSDTLDVNICEKVLNFMYTGDPEIDINSAGYILETAQLMQISSLRKACLEFLSEHLSKSNCIFVWEIASTHGFDELEARAFSLVKKHFQEVCTSDDFVNLCKVDYILDVLKGSNLKCPDSSIVCKAALSWINADLDNRIDSVSDVMEALFSFPTMVDQIEAVLADQEYLELRENTECKRVVQALRDKHSVLQPVSQVDFTQFIDESLMVVGGNETGANQDFECFSFPQKKWFKLAPLPSDIGYDFAVCSYSTNVFVSGGTQNKNAFWRYLGEENAWSVYPNLPSPRQHHCMAVVRNNLYVLGGYASPNSRPSNQIDSFDLQTRHWRTNKRGEKSLYMALPVRSASCVVHNTNIYIVGGMDASNEQVNIVQLFNAKELYSCMLFQKLPVHSNVQYRPVVVNDKLYIVTKSGDVLSYPMCGEKPVTTVGKIPSSYFPRMNYGICEFENSIMMVGGTVKFQPRADMIQYNIDKSFTFPMQEKMPTRKRQFGYCKSLVLRRHLSSVDE